MRKYEEKTKGPRKKRGEKGARKKKNLKSVLEVCGLELAIIRL